METSIIIGILIALALGCSVIAACFRKPNQEQTDDQEHPHNPGGGDTWSRH